MRRNPEIAYDPRRVDFSVRILDTARINLALA